MTITISPTHLPAVTAALVATAILLLLLALRDWPQSPGAIFGSPWVVPIIVGLWAWSMTQLNTALRQVNDPDDDSKLPVVVVILWGIAQTITTLPVSLLTLYHVDRLTRKLRDLQPLDGRNDYA